MQAPACMCAPARHAQPRRCHHGHSRILVTELLERLGAGWNAGLRDLHLLVDECWRCRFGSDKRPGRRHTERALMAKNLTKT